MPCNTGDGVMSLVGATVSTDALGAFLSTFGYNITDLRCEIKDMKLQAAVDVETHYFQKSIPIVMGEGVMYKAGEIPIPHLDKVVKFVKSCKEPNTIIRYVSGMFTLSNGNDEFSVPTYEGILSAQSLSRAKMAISAAQKNGWTKLGRAVLENHGTLEIDSIKDLSTMSKVAAKDSAIKVEININDEMIITAGNSRGARMCRTVDIDSQAKSAPVETVFGQHMPDLARLMPSGSVQYHMGNRSALVLQHMEVDALMILKHQEGADK